MESFVLFFLSFVCSDRASVCFSAAEEQKVLAQLKWTKHTNETRTHTQSLGQQIKRTKFRTTDKDDHRCVHGVRSTLTHTQSKAEYILSPRAPRRERTRRRSWRGAERSIWAKQEKEERATPLVTQSDPCVRQSDPVAVKRPMTSFDKHLCGCHRPCS